MKQITLQLSLTLTTKTFAYFQQYGTNDWQKKRKEILVRKIVNDTKVINYYKRNSTLEK